MTGVWEPIDGAEAWLCLICGSGTTGPAPDVDACPLCGAAWKTGPSLRVTAVDHEARTITVDSDDE